MLALFVLFLVVLALLSSERIGTKGIQKLAEETPGYDCPEGKPCVTCMVGGESCDCGPEVCQCGDNIVPRGVCE